VFFPDASPMCCVVRCGVVAVVGVKGKREGEREEKRRKRLDV